ncbi:MAG TPA: hypothetical protein VMX55_13145 [candidate division Zixibacteria bacterium]|nr:hypothetical protein [candidate division Zixibacteria bacterium]
MVEPPRLQAQFDARQKIIPILFEKYCKENYKLEIIPPKKEKDPKPGPIARPTFRVLDSSGELVAFFNPWGNAECYKDKFKELYEKLVREIEKTAKDALRDFEGY